MKHLVCPSIYGSCSLHFTSSRKIEVNEKYIGRKEKGHRFETQNNNKDVIREWPPIKYQRTSSRIRILFLLKMARARQSSCRCPTLKLEPPSDTIVLMPFGNSEMASIICDFCKASRIASSECIPNKSRFSRTVHPLNNVGTCGITDIEVRSRWSPTSAMFTSSIFIDPRWVSKRRNNVCTIVPEY